MHAGDRRAQLVGCAQDEFAAHSLEGALFGDVTQHHDGPHAAALAHLHRCQGPGQHPGFPVTFDLQVGRRLLQQLACQYLTQRFVHRVFG